MELIESFHKSNFNTILEGFISVFIVLANDGWMKLYISHYKSSASPITASIFFFTLIIIGQMILLNLFISVLIDNFEQISVRNDLVKKLTQLKQESYLDRFKHWLFKNCKVCRGISGVQYERKFDDLTKGQNIIEEMIDEKR
jgi:Ion transport protein